MIKYVVNWVYLDSFWVIWTHFGLFGLIISYSIWTHFWVVWSYHFILLVIQLCLCVGNKKNFGHFCVEVFNKIPSSSMKFESLYLTEFYKTLYTKRFTMEIRLECRCLQKCFLIWNYYVGCLWAPLLVLTQGKETGFWSNFVFFTTKKDSDNIIHSYVWENNTLMMSFWCCWGP